MNFHIIYSFMPRILRCLLAGLLGLAIATPGLAQTAPPPTPATTPDEGLADKLQLRIGLNAARSFRHTGYYGLGAKVPLSAGAEYALNRRFTLYGQFDADLGLFRHDPWRNIDKPLLPSGALSFGARYYYNQAGRARHDRACGPFAGNYLALELHTEMLRYQEFVVTSPYPALDGYYALRTECTPSLNLLWGMQRRLSRNFLFDLNADVGLSPVRSDAHFGGYSSGGLNLSTQVNLGVYFGR